MFSHFSGRRRFDDLSEREALALAIATEEDDARIYRSFADALRDEQPEQASQLEALAEEEDAHRRRLLDRYAARFGASMPLIRREHVAGFYARRPIWLSRAINIDRVRHEVVEMERQARGFYERAARRSTDAPTRKLFGDLAAAESGHERMGDAIRPAAAESLRDVAERKRRFILIWVQPGLAGLMDGSVSTLAPIFATAFATQDPRTTFLVGLAASLGAGLSMGFTEAASDDGVISGRGSPIKRAFASGVMTTIGGLGHALPYLISDFWTATAIAMVVVFIELWAIVWIQKRFMETPFWRATLQVVLGGALVFATGILIGGA